jgi:hypothetical protein
MLSGNVVQERHAQHGTCSPRKKHQEIKLPENASRFSSPSLTLIRYPCHKSTFLSSLFIRIRCPIQHFIEVIVEVAGCLGRNFSESSVCVSGEIGLMNSLLIFEISKHVALVSERCYITAFLMFKTKFTSPKLLLHVAPHYRVIFKSLDVQPDQKFQPAKKFKLKQRHSDFLLHIAPHSRVISKSVLLFNCPI